MHTAQHPARQLNSKSIRDAVVSYVVPAVQRRFCVVSANCVWRVEGNENSMGRAWEFMVCEKRSQCDGALEHVPGVAFFFSAISSRETRTTQKEKSDTLSKNHGVVEVDEADTISYSQRTDVSKSSAINTAVEKGRLPGISYWVALESPNGAPISLVHMHRRLLECEVEIDTKILNNKIGGSADVTKRLCTVLKDHSSSYVTDIVNASFQACFLEAVKDLEQTESLEEAEEELREHVLRFVLVKTPYAKEMKGVIEALVRAGLQLDVDGLDITSSDRDRASVILPKEITTDQCTLLINDIEILMTTLGYAIYQGTVYKKNPHSLYTYTYKCEVDAFIGALEGNESFKYRLVKYGDKVRDKIKNPNSQLIHQIEVVHDLIEVNGGWCLSLSRRQFAKNLISEEKVGKITPRAYFDYDHNTQPDAKFFQEILENSLNPEEISLFCNDFLNLLQFQNKRHKEKVPCLVGDANSGKTSLFGIVPPSKIARVTKQKSFSKAMIDKKTEVIFIDEATVNIMDIDDWKLLTQGGWTAHDRKFSTARGFVNRCPMLLTCQRELEFQSEDQEAMDSRLNIYHFKRLPRKDPKAFQWLKSHPIECIIWAINNAGVQVTEASEDGHHRLSKQEQEELYSFNLDCSLEETTRNQSPSKEFTIAEELNTEPSTARSLQHDLINAQNEYNPKSFRGRLYARLVERTGEMVSLEREIVQKMVKSRRLSLVEQGILDENKAREFIQHPLQELPEHVRQKQFEVAVQKREQRKVEEHQKEVLEAQRVFNNPWVLQKEQEMFQYCEKREKCRNAGNPLEPSGDHGKQTETVPRERRDDKQGCRRGKKKSMPKTWICFRRDEK